MSIVGSPVIPLGNRILASSVTYRRNKVRYDWAIADLALLAATSKDFPYTRSTAPFRKYQFDNSSNPGEQTLTNWWLRSQSSFHEGTGITFMEPVSDDTIDNAFADSAGVNPWTAGKMTLLRNTTLKNAASVDTLVMGAIDGTTDVFFQAEGATLSRETSGGTAAVTWGGAATILSMTNDGANYYVADNVSIWKGTLAGGAGSAVWNTGSSNVVVHWAKQRLVAGIGNSLYELTGTGPTLPSAVYSHPSTGWKWTAIAEGPAAILAAGYNGSQSAIYKFVLSTSGVMPTLTSGIVAARMPTGEQIVSMTAYLGTYLAIGTTKGVRIGVISDTGDVSYGPLVIASTAPVYGLAGYGQYVWATCTNQINGKSGLWRIDLGNPRDDGTFPYATDLQAGVTGTVNSVAVFGATDRMVFGVSGSGSYLEDVSTLVASGYFRTGYIRFNTIEPKQFRYVSVRVDDTNGSVGIETYDRAGAASSIASVSGYDASDYDLGRSSSEEYLALRFTLTRSGSDTTKGPTMRSWQVKALPAVKRSRLIQVPILLFQEMKDTKGASVPPTDVHAVLAALEQYEDAAAPILFTELGHNPNRTELVVIDEVRFQEVSPPAGRCQGEGGIAYLTLRTVQ